MQYAKRHQYARRKHIRLAFVLLGSAPVKVRQRYMPKFMRDCKQQSPRMRACLVKDEHAIFIPARKRVAIAIRPRFVKDAGNNHVFVGVQRQQMPAVTAANFTNIERQRGDVIVNKEAPCGFAYFRITYQSGMRLAGYLFIIRDKNASTNCASASES